MLSRHLLLQRHLTTLSRGHDYQNIMNILNKFLWCMDRNDSETFATLFTSDGKIEIKKTKLIFDSPEKLKKLCSNIYNQFSPALHLETNFVIEIDPHNPNQATNRSYWYSLHGGEVISTGFHHDDLVYEGDRWLFKRRVTTHYWTKNGGFEPINHL